MSGSDVVDPPTTRGNLQLVAGSLSPVAQRAARARANRSVPLVRVDHDLDLVIDEAVRAIAAHPLTYQRNSRLVDVVDGKIREISIPTLRERLSSVGEYRKQKNGKWLLPGIPNDYIVHGVYNRGNWGARPLVGVVQTPFLRTDGSIVQTPGYDEKTSILYQPDADFPPIPTSPTRDDAIDALSRVVYPLKDFPWRKVDNKSPSLSAYVALLLTLLLRPAIDGPIPGWIITANTRGTGKTRLAQIASIVAFGQHADTKVFSKDEDEVRKKITGVLKAGSRLVVFDNVKRPIGGESIEMATTSPIWSDRDLGTMNDLRLPNLALFLFTGNNLRTEQDASRRFIPVDLESDRVNPEDRDDFTIKDLLGWTKENRADLVTSLLVMARAWFVAECPSRGRALGSFEEWSAIIPSILTWLGVSSPLVARTASDVTEDTDRLGVVRLADWWESMCAHFESLEQGITVSMVLRYLYPIDKQAVTADVVTYREELEAIVEESNKGAISRALSYRLRSARRRKLDDRGRHFETGTKVRGDVRWRILRSPAPEAVDATTA